MPAAASGSALAAQQLQQGYISVIRHVTPAVVQISTSSDLGSGVVFDDHGDVVTNAHVVAPGGPLHVTDAEGHTYRATLVGKFTENDLAVVHTSDPSLKPASFAPSGATSVGDIVLALGNPLGLRSSVTSGIISALGRTVSEPNGVVLPNVIQTSAPINPGNSGGALVNLRGQVVGIPTLAATDQQLGGGAAPGIGFAIPSPVVSDIAGQLVKYGRVVNSHRAFLGVTLGTGVVQGAIVTSVKQGSPAAHAGIVPGDVIVSLDKHPTPSPVAVATVLARLKPGQSTRVSVVQRSGKRATMTVKLGRYP
ncbi:MAG TPA: trypsin-like peptidase domain-containing protein [Solirubrobacteraceae bacterium]|nr:trypsin-like peptidase domain-containing protein [Solirubrobacteraceae bacterium]